MPLYRFVQNLYYMLKTILYIGAGSFAGGIMRYLLTRAIQHYSTLAFPLGTMIVNITGCFLIGILYGLFERNFINSTDLRLFLTVGVCGGFTTFSTFVHDNYTLFNDRNIAYMILYSMLSLGLGLLFAHWGHVLIKAE